ncbi:sugar-binding protein [Streptomyces microflavus]|uniref:RHS repeat-associated core domain-containing protein n=1 Tax=Streptomyces microflavus TaxID=1919 RepID=UPI00225AE616|nr:RHS repeat-associated core domain-containing protein [Streptomyces microflavus]MCX4654737.1 sugar-binding protein [Streptomyces microflavus]
MVGGLLQGAAQPAAAAEATSLPGLPTADRPVRGGETVQVKPRTVTKGAGAPRKAPRSSWPEAGKATVVLPPRAAKQPRVTGGLGDLPVDIVPVKKAREAAEGRVEARVLSQEQAMRFGIEGLLFTLEPKDSAKSVRGAQTEADVAGKVALTVDYQDFAEPYGGSYASRLRLVELPACALTTPDSDKCRTATPVPTQNDVDGQTLTAAEVSLRSSRATVLAAVADTGGEKGDYKATSLSASATWNTNLNTGDFTWSYDMPVPEVPGDLKPVVGLDYSSASIDGRTSGTNNQSSWVGDGFDLWPGYIERRYKQCSDDGEKNADGSKPGDLCWAYDNAFISFNGKGGELVPAGGGEFKLKQDDGTRIAKLASTERGNGDDDGEYWRLTDPDGTRFYFGYHRLPGWTEGKETTGSAWTTPVFGNNAGEPCHASGFAGSWCQQAWRWNLDYVVDTHGNAMSYHYAKETNSYGRNLKADDDTPYTRSGYLKRIDYGIKSSAMYAGKPPAQVVFGNAERCLPQTGVTCAPDTIDDKAFYWYDTPWDLNCKTGAKCDNGRLAPSFWTRMRLTDVTTQLLKADGTYGKVDSWKLGHRWGMADTDYQLLLDSVQHTGHTDTAPITLPKTTFSYTQLANRLDEIGDGFAPFIKSRLSGVADESGGQISANYSAPACDKATLPKPETNTTRCFPQYIGGDGTSPPEREWFNKYVVTSVTATDRTGGSPDQVAAYEYLGGAAWHFDDDDGLTKEKHKTWSQWRGYGHVRVQKGGQGGAAAMKSQEEHYFLRGMNGDRKDTGGGTKPVSVPLGAGEGDAIIDHGALAGFEYKTVSFDKPGGKVLGKNLRRPWHHETATKVRDWGTATAGFTGISQNQVWTSLDQGAGAKWRTTSSSAQYDTVAGRVVRVDDRGDTSVATDDRCTRTTFATNTDKNILGLPSQVETVAKACDATVDRSKDVVNDVRTAYDGGSYGAAPVIGDATATAALKSHDGTKATYLEAGATYDGYGRELTVTDLTATVTVSGAGAPVRTARTDGRTTTTAFTPAAGLPTQTRTTTPPAKATDPSTRQTTVKDLDPLRGLATKETDTNGAVTRFMYDALGRSTKVWLADRSASSTPTYEYGYTVAEGQPVAVATKLLDNDGGQITSYKLYDGFLRERQSQAPGPEGGRIISDAFYDERGLVTLAFAPYYATGRPVTQLFEPVDALSVETQTRTAYDGLARPVEERQIAGNGDGGTVLSSTRTTYFGDRTTIIPPVGATATTTLTDARGNVTELRQHHTRSAEAAYDSTVYTHTPNGDLAKVTDPAGNSWTYTYDQLGNKIAFSDPDRGRTESKYDDRGQLTSTTDARGITLTNVYDNLGRKTELREGSSTGKLRAGWTYDTITGAQGQLAESTRYVDGAAYTTKVTLYDKLYRAVKTSTVIPESEGALAGTYQSGTLYKPSGLIGSISYSAAGSLPGGSVNYTHEDETLRTVAVFGQGMTSAARYSHTGKPLQYTFGLTDGGRKTQLTNTYEWGTQRLATARVDREDQPGVDQHVSFGYDEAGNVRSLTDVSRTGIDSQCFTYDYLRRLTNAWAQGEQACTSTPGGKVGGPAPYWHAYSYDKAGNRLTEKRHDPAGDSTQDITRTYAYPPAGTPRAHTLSSVTTQGPAGTSTTDYAYDDSGNTTGRGAQGLDWDAEGLLAKVTEPAEGKPDRVTAYVYDAAGSRLISRTGSGTTLHLGHTDVTVDKGATKARATRYIDLGNGHQAVRSDDGSFSFSIADHHGTGLLAVAAKDLAVSQRRVLPFGGSRGTAAGAWPGTRGFVGGIDETKETGLVHLGAREYDPQAGRFISVDPVMDPSDPQQLHGYTYGNNNPLVYADPSGKWFGFSGLFNFINDIIERVLNRMPNKNAGFMRPRAKAPAVTNKRLGGALQQIYPKARTEGKPMFGDGKMTTAIIEEFNTGKRLEGKKQLHVEKGWSTMKGLSDVLEKDERARETGKNPQNILSDRDLAVAKAEAKELWNALNSRDVTGNIKKIMDGDANMKASVKKSFSAVVKTSAVSGLTGQQFEAVPHKGPQPVGQPTRLRGFAKGFGIAGGALSVAQAPGYVDEYGAGRGSWELFKVVIDPFGVSDGQDPYVGGGCGASGENCA